MLTDDFVVVVLVLVVNDKTLFVYLKEQRNCFDFANEENVFSILYKVQKVHIRLSVSLFFYYIILC